MSPKKKGFNKFFINGNITIIYVKNKKNEMMEVIIDTFNLERISSLEYHWYPRWDKKLKGYYIGTTVYERDSDGKLKHKTVDLHKFIMKSIGVEHVDHINHNTLDNREENLRVGGADKNTKNRGKINSNNTSGYRNVSLMGNWFKVQLQIDKKHVIFPEKFSNPNDAGLFAEEMRKKYYGEN